MTAASDVEALLDQGVVTPPNLVAIVDVLGIDATLSLVLDLGGSEVYLPKKSGETSMLARSIGAPNVERLAESMGSGLVKIPLARRWVAEILIRRGYRASQIARTLKVDVKTVRKWLGPQTSRQLDLFTPE